MEDSVARSSAQTEWRGSVPATEQLRILPHLIRQPGLPWGVLRRDRLDRHFDAQFHSCRVLAVSGAPGAGKTVQAQLYAGATPRPTFWITLSDTEQSGRRLMLALSAAMADHRRSDAETAMRSAFRLDGTVEETAATIAQTVRPEPALLVIDECEHLDFSAEALSALDTFIQNTPDDLRVLLLSRSNMMGPLQHRVQGSRILLIDEAVLRLTEEENGQLAELLGGAQESVARVRQATGGWPAGAAFGYRYGLGEHDPPNSLPSVIMAEFFAQLPVDEQQFLLDSSVPPVLTRDIAAALCGPTAHRLWDTVRSRHLPATTMTGGTVVYHALFRSFLHHELLARDTNRHKELVLQYADHLVRAKHFEDATEAYLSVGARDEACQTAEQATPGLCSRSDWATFIRWAGRLGDNLVNSKPLLLAALVRSMFGQRRFEESIDLVRRLDRSGALRAATHADPALLATAAWALQANPAEAQRLLDRYEGDYRAEAVGFMLQVSSDVAPVGSQLGHDWGDVERIVAWGLFLQGRLTSLAELAPKNQDAPVFNPNVIFAPIFAGDLSTARRWWERVPLDFRERPQSHFVEAALLLFSGQPEQALSAIELSLSDSRKTNFFLAPAYEIFSNYILLELGRAEDAIPLLLENMERVAASGRLALLEWAQAFQGFALLLTGEPESARLILHEAVRSMHRARRRLFLPLAAACLAEAEARCGNVDASHEAADLAYETATIIGGFTSLCSVLRAFPLLHAREIQHDPGDRWRRIVVSPSARRSAQAESRPGSGARIALQPFGAECDIFVDGAPLSVGRLKIVELLAFLVLHPQGVDRNELQNALFPDATLHNGGNHFRQISFRFKQISGISLKRGDHNQIGLPADSTVDAADLTFERLVFAATAASGADRISLLRDALEPVRGSYLVSSNLTWAEERRTHLEVVREEAGLELVRLLLEFGQPEEARDQCESLLALNRYCDPAYRLRVKIEQAIGSESSVLAIYRRAISALDELGLDPGDARRWLDSSPGGRPMARTQGKIKAG